MKKILVLCMLTATCLLGLAWSGHPGPRPQYIPPTPQRLGDPDLGYQYLLSSAYIKSGVPYYLYRASFGQRNKGYLEGHGDLGFDFSMTTARNGQPIVSPNCLQCHAERLDDSLVIGLGSTSFDFTRQQVFNFRPVQDLVLASLQTFRRREYEAVKQFATSTRAIDRELFVETRGVSGADRLFALLASWRDPVTLQWNPGRSMQLPAQVIPSDVPAWWLLKKKHALYYSGEGRGDIGKFLMSAALLTLQDTLEAREIDSHMPDVLSYLYTVKPPVYPYGIDESMAVQGKTLFNDLCSQCHGTYGDQAVFPNLLIPQEQVNTDPWLHRSNFQDTAVTNWYNSSWFATGADRAWLQPFNGYLAPPLDGIWATAPYFHNGSVPALEQVLDSRSRPARWTRDNDKRHYDRRHMRLHYSSVKRTGGKRVYDTSIPGYGNQGHTFGDRLHKHERKALIEYLKTI